MALTNPLTAKRWIGAAQDVPRIYTLTFGGTWATNDTATLTVNNKALTVTVGSATTTADVAAAFNAAFNGAAVVGTEKRNTTGPAIGELYLCSSTVSGAVVTITGVPGKPLTAAASKVSTSGTVSLSSVQAPTGKHWMDNTANYSDATVPVDGNSLVVKDTNVSLLYDLTILSNLAQLDVYSSFTGRIGLPDINSDNPAIPYPQYVATHATLRNAAVVNLGVDDGGTGATSVRLIGSGTGSDVLNVYRLGSKASDVPAALEVENSTDLTLWVASGDVDLVNPTDAVIDLGYQTNAAGEVTLTIIDGSVSTLELRAGTVKATDVALGAVTTHAGELWAAGATTITTGVFYGGTLIDASTGTFTTLSFYGAATYDARRHTRAKAITNPIEVYSSAVSLLDPNRTVSTFVADCNGVAVPTIDRGQHVRVTYGAPA